MTRTHDSNSRRRIRAWALLTAGAFGCAGPKAVGPQMGAGGGAVSSESAAVLPEGGAATAAPAGVPVPGAPGAPTKVTSVEGITEYRFPNGLKV
ncbi:MAG TPA: hypothetical protein VGG33_12250, partial [Polyangia bacterium]